MGTPPSRDFRARSNKAFDLGRSSMNFFCSDNINDCRWSRSIEGIHLPKLSRRLHSEEVAILVEQRLVVKWLYKNLPVAATSGKNPRAEKSKTILICHSVVSLVCALV
jgi:hypothetical protein